MKKCSNLAPLLLGFVTASVQAGQEVYKQVAPPPPPPPLYGTGFYGAIDIGANVYQDTGDVIDKTLGTRTFRINGDPTPFTFDVKIDPKHDVGLFGGIKLGYVFGTGVVRPTLEGDFFYNGFRPGADLTLNASTPGHPDLFTTTANFNTWINSGAFMGNFILRFAPGNQRFQPYVGAGVGVYYMQSEGVNIEALGGNLRFHVPPEHFSTFGDRAAFADLAWQVIAGADYYWNPKFSTFIEYHFLEYTGSTQLAVRTPEQKQKAQDIGLKDLDLGQQLVGVGVRFHF